MSEKDDSEDLATFGYKQELDRTLGSFSSFAAGFSYISILTGMFQLFYLGFGFGGPAFFWSWPLVFFGQFLTALCFAELSAHYPLSGSVYQWSKQVGTKFTGWFTGWVYLFCLIVTIAAVALALQTTLPQISPSFQIIGDINNPVDSAKNAVLLGCILIIFTTIINSIGVGLLAVLNNIGVFAELIGVLILIILFFFNAERSPDIVFSTLGKGSGESYIGPFLAAALTSSYVLFGYDTAGSLAEETTEPRKKVPKAIIQALSTAGLMGTFVMISALMAVKNINSPEIAMPSGGLPFIVKNVLGETWGNIFLIDVIMAIVACVLAVQTGTVRLIFAMARDNTLPFSNKLSHVSKNSKTPIIPAVITGLIAIGILILNVNIPKIISLVTSMAVLWANLAYLCVTSCLLIMRFKGWPKVGGSNVENIFSLGKFGIPINITAVIFGILIVINLSWPRVDVYGDQWYQLYAAPLFTGILIASGLIYYFLFKSKNVEILDEHKISDKDNG